MAWEWDTLPGAREHRWRSVNLKVAIAVCIVVLFVMPGQSIVQGSDHHATPWTPLPRSEPPKGEGMVSSSSPVLSPTSGVGQVNGTLCLFNNHLWPGNNPSACDNGIGPVDAVFDSANGDIYVTNYNSNNVSVVSGASNTVVAAIPVGSWPYGAAYDGANGDIYVTNYDSNTVSVVSGASNKVVATIPVGSWPDGAAYDGANGDIYVTNYNSNNVNVVSGASNTVVATITVGSGPVGAAYDGANGDIYVTNEGSNNVSVVSGASNTVVAAIPVGANPYGAAYDGANGDIYVTDYSSGAVSIITTGPAPSTYPVSFSESGLPAGTSWSITLAGKTLSSTTGTISFNEPNGTYPFTVGAVAGYTANITSGSVTINGASKTVSITFTKSSSGATYAVTFSENGLPSGTSWSVTLGSTVKAGTGSISFTEPNGTYTFSVGAVAGYTSSPSSGSVPIKGAAVSVSVTFTALPPGQYSLIFTEIDLPTGTNWSVTVGSTTHTSTGSTISFNEVNGTYHYTVGTTTGYTSSPSSGNVTVNGASKTVAIAFAKVSTGAAYAVTFTETGLPSGTSWFVTLNGSTKSSTTATITFQEANDSYSFTVGTVSGYTVSPTSGSVKVNGGPTSQSVTFTKSKQTTGFLGLPGYEGYILIVAIVAAVTAVVGLLTLHKRKGAQPTLSSVSVPPQPPPAGPPPPP